jgi:hypothetical protein
MWLVIIIPPLAGNVGRFDPGFLFSIFNVTITKDDVTSAAMAVRNKDARVVKSDLTPVEGEGVFHISNRYHVAWGCNLNFSSPTIGIRAFRLPSNLSAKPQSPNTVPVRAAYIEAVTWVENIVPIDPQVPQMDFLLFGAKKDVSFLPGKL